MLFSNKNQNHDPIFYFSLGKLEKVPRPGTQQSSVESDPSTGEGPRPELPLGHGRDAAHAGDLAGRAAQHDPIALQRWRSPRLPLA